MDIQNLSEGSVYKNYKGLCEVLNIIPKTSNSKNAQLKDLERYVRYHKEGNKFVIDKIFDVPLDKVDGRVNNKNIDKIGRTKEYCSPIEKLILDMLATSNEGKVFLPINRLLRAVSITNENYGAGLYKQKALSQLIGLDVDIINDFYTSNHRSFKNDIEKILDRLEKSFLINYSKEYTVVQSYVNPLTKKKNDLHREATEEEKRIISSTHYTLLDSMRYLDIADCIRKGGAKDFYKNLDKELKILINIDGCYKSYKIIFTPDNIEDAIKKRSVPYDKREEYSIFINNLSQKYSTNRAVSRQKKALKTVSNNKIIASEKVKTRALGDYVSDSKELSDILLSRDAKSLTKELYKMTSDNEDEMLDDIIKELLKDIK